MRRVLALILVLAAAPLAAQRSTPGLELGVDLSHWTLGFGNGIGAGPERTGGSVRLGVLLPGRPELSLAVAASHAAEDSTAPGLRGLTGEVAARVFRVKPGDPNVFVQLGGGALHVAGDERQAVIDRCVPDDLCMYEGPSLPRTGWYRVMSAGAGIDLPFSSAFVVQPTASVMKVFGEGLEGTERSFLRLGIGVAIRP